jgi:hypothetical protein
MTLTAVIALYRVRRLHRRASRPTGLTALPTSRRQIQDGRRAAPPCGRATW